ncbi:BREX-1 system adenine-specific DNA-methyltransferase PglX [Rhizobium pusense]|uniref:HsdM family class I SAM-dependent methyltransferase n=1 Tax=Agrobacterium pusense TaxID=648995 RepID=UPI002447E500|nr:N-6 DNA methylase [Agrobacterium pusense]MDH1270501.1 BREX-1 system adenine-specific DNA-methyltransferase PglX [Agrobacterium pusense]
MDSQGRELLDQVYSAFSERSNDLLDAVAQPGALGDKDGPDSRWTDLGDWLSLARRLGAEKVLFVRGDPVAVFSDAREASDEAALGELYRRAWCMTEPRCLFVALPQELRVYDLNTPPKRGGPPSDPWRVLSTAADVLKLTHEIDEYGPDLQGLMEAGNSAPARADRRLIDDLRHVRSQLEATGLSMAEAHALIGRSILVRYLEDRGVLTQAYFDEVAGGNQEWRLALSSEGAIPVLGPPGKQRLYDRVLSDADFTHALFKKLATDFNGDLFALGEAREKRFGDEALKLLRAFLLGEIQAGQQPLFFWAYDFEVVPLALISSIYEQFYHDALSKETVDKIKKNTAASSFQTDNGGASARATSDEVEGSDFEGSELKHGAGTHYTPANLVHDALRRTLTPHCLAVHPKILDPACGSGIFLVEAFRRIVRYEAQERKRKLSPDELRDILRHRIFGIEINAEAARVAAFSLYLALLDQQEPPDIASGAPLPYLLHSVPRDEKHFGILVVSDAFALTDDEREFLSKRVADKKTYKGRSGDVSLLNNAGVLDLPLGGFDVVIGNPPWQEAPPLPRGWAAAFRLPEGEGAYSQLFIHRALTLLREGGRLGLLIGMKVFWNDRDTSRAFRSHLLAHAALKQIVNMAHVRRVFFAKAVAPFAFLLAEKRPPAPNAQVVFWNARRVGSVERLRSIAAVPLDRRIVAQTDLAEADYLWKLYWWGGHHDAALVARLGLERTLGETVVNTDPQPRYGWQRGTTAPSGKLATLFELNNKKVEAFGPVQEGWFLPPPSGIKRDPDQRIYGGQRLVITRGVREPIGPIARLEKQEFSFRHSFYCIPLPHLSLIEAKLTLGTLWSSLGRYLLFMTAGNWGGWHDQVTSRDVLRVPVRLKPSWGMPKTKHNDAAMRIVQAVSQLRELPPENPHIRGLFDASSDDNPKESWLAILDEAIFDLFELTKAERDLVEDFWAENHELYWKGAAAEATKRLTLTGAFNGTRANLSETSERSGLQPYLRAFLEAWNEQLPEGSEFSWQVATSPARDAVAVVFTLGGAAISAQQGPDWNWESIVAQCAEALNQPISPAFYTKRVVRKAAADNFIILRENTRRLWTASTAREDAEALFVQLAVRSEG